MKKFPGGPGVALLLMTLLVGCETDGGISARTHEKADVYAGLEKWQKNYIEKGLVTNGFTPDMVYIALGRPTKVEPVELEGNPAELWTYARCYLTEYAASILNQTKFHAPMHILPIPAPVIPPNQGNTNQESHAEGISMSGPFHNTGMPTPPPMYTYTVEILMKNGTVYRAKATATKEYEIKAGG